MSDGNMFDLTQSAAEAEVYVPSEEVLVFTAQAMDAMRCANSAEMRVKAHALQWIARQLEDNAKP